MMLRVSDMMRWWRYMVAVQWNFNRYACRLGTIQSNIPPDPLEIKRKSYMTGAPPSDMLTNTMKLYQPRLLHCQYNITCRVESCYVSAAATYMPAGLVCRVESCYVAAAATYMPAGLVLLSQTPLLIQTCLLVEYCCKIDACWTVATQSACLLTFCHSILHVCWRCGSLSAIPAGMVSHFQPCLLVWCLIISRAWWCGESL